MGIGCTIAFLHDIADIFGCLVKCASTTNKERITLYGFVIMACVWFWTRLYVLPSIIKQIFQHKDEYDSEFRLFVLINGFFLCILQLLHVYWFFLFLVMIAHKLKTGKAEDL